jgi:hypothetical protein
MSETPKVYAAIAAVMGKLSKEGIAKNRNNSQQGYKFRGIDDVYNALAPYLSESKLLILPRVLSREVTERQTQKGGTLFYVVLDVEFDLVSGEDGSKHTIKVVGEAMDSADKATNKAMSAAYKYACMEAFCIPTEGDNDADATTHEVQPVTPPEGYDKWKADIGAVADEGTARLQDVWKSSAATLRNFAVKHDLQWWNGCKDRATKVKNAA